jgi:hypothetical protein
MDVLWMVAMGVVCVASSTWVYVDARTIGVARGQAPGALDLGPRGWLVACLVGWLIVFPAYLMMRDDYRRANGLRPTPARAQAGAVRWVGDDGLARVDRTAPFPSVLDDEAA